MRKSTTRKKNPLLDLWTDKPVRRAEWDTYAYIGEFLCTYSAVEGTLTRLLSYSVRPKSPGHFELVTRGMDAHVKSVRLRDAIKLDGGTIGPNMTKRFAIFERSMVKRRNMLVHNWMDIDPQEKDVIQLATISKSRLTRVQPPKVSVHELSVLAYWLSGFNFDLVLSYEQLLGSGTFEIDAPLSRPQLGEPPKNLLEAIQSMFGKPPEMEPPKR